MMLFERKTSKISNSEKVEGWCFFTRGYFKKGRLLER